MQETSLQIFVCLHPNMMPRILIAILIVLIGECVVSAGQISGTKPDEQDDPENVRDETVINQGDRDITSTVVDVPQFFNISRCPKCEVDENYEQGTHGGYLSCECVRNANGRVQSDMKVDDKNRNILNAIFGRGTAKKTANLSELYWPSSQSETAPIPYVIGPGFSGNHEGTLFQAIDMFTKHTCVRFVDRTTEKDFIEIVGQDGCWSYLGKRGGKQQLSLGKDCGRTGIILHQLLHALGFFHEQSRPDRDQFVSIQLENVIPGEEDNFDKATTTDIFMGQPYDYDSVMHFGPRAYSKNSEKTILVKNDSYQGEIGQRDALSPLDIFKINTVYCGGRQKYDDETNPQQRSGDQIDQCGIPEIKPNAHQRIVGGVMVEPGSIPWQASIRFNKRHSPICGGTLIDREWVLTAAHCVKTRLTKYYSVYLGINEKYPPSKKPDHVVLLKVIKVIVHADYNSTSMKNDIALLQLEKAVQLNDHIIPVCLPPTTRKVSSGTRVSVSGWGDTSEYKTRATHLLKVDLEVLEADTCKKWLAPHVIYESMFCAGYENGQKDACQGDSGGPLTEFADGRHYLIGVVSWGLGCAQKKKPGVYSKVSFYRNWILKNSGI